MKDCGYELVTKKVNLFKLIVGFDIFVLHLYYIIKM